MANNSHFPYRHGRLGCSTWQSRPVSGQWPSCWCPGGGAGCVWGRGASCHEPVVSGGPAPWRPAMTLVPSPPPPGTTAARNPFEGEPQCGKYCAPGWDNGALCPCFVGRWPGHESWPLLGPPSCPCPGACKAQEARRQCSSDAGSVPSECHGKLSFPEPRPSLWADDAADPQAAVAVLCPPGVDSRALGCQCTSS